MTAVAVIVSVVPLLALSALLVIAMVALTSKAPVELRRKGSD